MNKGGFRSGLGATSLTTRIWEHQRLPSKSFPLPFSPCFSLLIPSHWPQLHSDTSGNDRNWGLCRGAVNELSVPQPVLGVRWFESKQHFPARAGSGVTPDAAPGASSALLTSRPGPISRAWHKGAVVLEGMRQDGKARSRLVVSSKDPMGLWQVFSVSSGDHPPLDHLSFPSCPKELGSPDKQLPHPTLRMDKVTYMDREQSLGRIFPDARHYRKMLWEWWLPVQGPRVWLPTWTECLRKVGMGWMVQVRVRSAIGTLPPSEGLPGLSSPRRTGHSQHSQLCCFQRTRAAQPTRSSSAARSAYHAALRKSGIFLALPWQVTERVFPVITEEQAAIVLPPGILPCCLCLQPPITGVWAPRAAHSEAFVITL
ncbi:unnamed protein product [Caretta caretta]